MAGPDVRVRVRRHVVQVDIAGAAPQRVVPPAADKRIIYLAIIEPHTVAIVRCPGSAGCIGNEARLGVHHSGVDEAAGRARRGLAGVSMAGKNARPQTPETNF